MHRETNDDLEDAYKRAEIIQRFREAVYMLREPGSKTEICTEEEAEGYIFDRLPIPEREIVERWILDGKPKD